MRLVGREYSARKAWTKNREVPPTLSYPSERVERTEIVVAIRARELSTDSLPVGNFRLAIRWKIDMRRRLKYATIYYSFSKYYFLLITMGSDLFIEAPR